MLYRYTKQYKTLAISIWWLCLGDLTCSDQSPSRLEIHTPWLKQFSRNIHSVITTLLESYCQHISGSYDHLTNLRTTTDGLRPKIIMFISQHATTTILWTQDRTLERTYATVCTDPVFAMDLIRQHLIRSASHRSIWKGIHISTIWFEYMTPVRVEMWHIRRTSSQVLVLVLVMVCLQHV